MGIFPLDQDGAPKRQPEQENSRYLFRPAQLQGSAEKKAVCDLKHDGQKESNGNDQGD